MSTPAAPKTIKEKLAAASAAFKSGENLQAKITDLESQHTAANTEIDRLTSALAEANALAEKRGGELTTANEKIAAHEKTISDLTKARDDFQAQADALPAKISAGVSEKCAELGIDISKMPKAAASETLTSGEPQTAADYVKAMSAENDPVKKKALFVQYQKLTAASNAGRN